MRRILAALRRVFFNTLLGASPLLCLICLIFSPFTRPFVAVATEILGSDMPSITLPDGSRRDYPEPVTIAEIAADIGAGLAKAALAGKVDGKIVDTSYRVERACPVPRVS